MWAARSCGQNDTQADGRQRQNGTVHTRASCNETFNRNEESYMATRLNARLHQIASHGGTLLLRFTQVGCWQSSECDAEGLANETRIDVRLTALPAFA